MPLVTIDPADAKDHDDAVHAEPDTDPNNPGGFIVCVAIADVAAYVRPGSALDREALRAATRSTSPTVSCRCCPSASPTISARCGRARTARALAVRMVIDADGRKRAHTFPPRPDALGRQAHLRAGAGRDRRPSGRHDRPAARAVLKPLWAAYRALASAAATSAIRSISICPSARSSSSADGTVDRRRARRSGSTRIG